MSSSQEHRGKVSTNEKQVRAHAKHEEEKAAHAAKQASAEQVAPVAAVAVRAAAPAAQPLFSGKRVGAIVRQNQKPSASAVAPAGASRAAILLAALKKPVVKQSGKKRLVPK
jgi:hypothetical protein